MNDCKENKDKTYDVGSLIAELSNKNIKLSLNGENLNFKAPKGAMTPKIIAQLKQNKEKITDYLKNEALENDKSILYSPIEPVEPADYYSVSAGQKRMFVLNRLDGESTAYNTTLTIKITGTPDIEKLKAVFKEITERHESLRTTFGMVDGEPVQYIHESVDFDIPLEVTNGGEEKVEEIIKDFIKPYDFSKLPLFRLKLIKLQESETYYLVIDIHHIISDGVSGAIITDEINALYNGEELPEPRVHYKDYAAWHTKLLSSPFMKKEKRFYLENLSGELPVLDLPCDFKRPNIFETEGESLHLFLNADLKDKINQLARKNKVTLFAALLAFYNILMSKYSRQDDIIVGSPTAGRIHSDTYSMCGIFLNTLPLRNFPKPEKILSDFIREVGKNCIKAFDNQDYPFDRLVEDLSIERDTSRNPVFSTMFVMQNMDTKDFRGEGFTSTRYDIKHKMAQVDITVNCTETKSGIDFEFNYCSALFKRETIERMLKNFENLIKDGVENQEKRLCELSMLTPADEQKIIYDFNKTDFQYEKLTLHGLFERSVKNHPTCPALYYNDKTITYDELNRRANSLAHTLIKKGIKPDDIVGILCDSSPEMAVAILAVLKSGGAYLPIKNDFPPERKKFMLEDSGAKLLLTTQNYIETVDCKVPVLFLENEENFSINTENPKTAVTLQNLAYVIYTSGTTGTPKGVLIEHATISQTIQWRAAEYQFGTDDCVVQLFAYSFDGFLAAFFTPLCAASAVVILPKDAEKDPSRVKREIIRHKVTSFISVPMLFSALIDSMKPEEMKSVRSITLAGDKTSQATIKKCSVKCPWVELVNEYGPTESTIVSTIARHMTAETSSVIGKPCGNTRILVLDKQNKLAPIGIPGELCVAGPRLARGYLNRAELTAKKFIENPYVASERLYKTGDMAKWLPDGNISFIGRTDFQVKIRGFRIETSEIEAELSKYPTVTDNVVIPKEDSSQNKYLCAYIVATKDFTVLEMRNFLLKSLPEYEIPSRFVKLEKIPLTPNGKLDRKALPEPEGNIDFGVSFVPPETKLQKTIANVWEEVLSIEKVGIDNNFFEVGGDSMSIIKLHAKLDELYPDVLTVTDLFSYPTIRKLSDYIKKSDSNEQSTEKETVETSSEDEVAIIGMSVNLPKAKTLDEFFDNICNKVNCVCDMPENRRKDAIEILKARRKDVESLEFEKLSYLDEIDKFDCAFFGITPAEAELMDPNQRIFLECAYNAAEDAGYGGNKLNGTKTGVFVGFGGDSDYGRFIASQKPETYSLAAAGNLTSVIAGRIAYFLNLKGPAELVNTACSSSLVAINNACACIKKGECDMAIAGGVKLFLDSVKNEFSMGIESADNKTRTFDDNSNGTGKGEGAAAIILKPLSKAIADGDSIYAVIKGSAVNQDGTSNGLTAPNPQAQAEVITTALKNAKVNPDTIGLIEAHGTGTKLGDPIEIDGITKAYRKFTKKKQFCAITSVKSNLGHTDNAAGVIGVVKLALALKKKQLPPTMNFEEPNRAINFVNSPVYVNDKKKAWQSQNTPRRAAVSAFGLSGTNCHIILEEAPTSNLKGETKSPEVLVFSAMNKDLLINLIDEYKKRYQNGIKDGTLRDLAYTANTTRRIFNLRAAVIVKGDFLEKLENLKLAINSNHSINGCYFNTFTLEGNSGNSITSKAQNELSKKAMKLLSSSEKNSEDALNELCRLFVSGADVDFSSLYKGEERKTLNAPTYPFERKRCWTDIKVRNNEVKKEPDIFEVKWDESSQKEISINSLKKVILVTNNSNTNLIDSLNKFAVINIKNVSQDVTDKVTDFTTMMRDKKPDTIVITIKNSLNSAHFEKDLKSQLEVIIGLVKSIKSFNNYNPELVFVTENANAVTGFENEINPQSALLIGLAKSIALENSDIRLRYIDTDSYTNTNLIAREIMSSPIYPMTAYRRNKRYTDALRPCNLESVPKRNFTYKENGFYVISGGTGRLGLKAAEFLAKKGKLNVALLSRHEKPEIAQKISALNENGANVFVCCCDITVEKSLKETISKLRNTYGKVNGIIHCAAVGVGKLSKTVDELEINDFLNVLAPKVTGTLNLNKLTRADNPDFFVSYSSGVTLIGGANASAYTAANAFLDSFAEKRTREGFNTLTVDWPFFKDTVQGDASGEEKLMFKPITSDDGLVFLEKLLQKNVSRAVVGKLNRKSEILGLAGKLPFDLCPELRETAKEEAVKQVNLTGRESGTYSDIEKKVASVFGETLGVEEIGINDDFFGLGGNSLLAIRFEAMAEKAKLKLSSTDLYNEKTVEALAKFLSGEKPDSQANLAKKEAAAIVVEDDKATDVVEIENIEPFNDVFYRSCFYNSFFPIVKLFGRKIEPFLCADVQVLAVNDGMLTSEFKSRQPIIETMKEQGIASKTYEFSDDSIAIIKENLKKSNPVIVWVDCFYEPIRRDMYNKTHWPHSILLYGIDTKTQEFLAVEHKFKDNLSYEKQRIPYDAVFNMLKGYKDNFQDMFDESSINVFSQIAFKTDNSNYQKTYAETVQHFKSLALERTELISSFANTFEECVSDEMSFEEKGQTIITAFNEILNAKEAEKYTINKLFPEDEETVSAELQNLCDKWSRIRRIVAKGVYSGTYNHEKLMLATSKIRELQKLEQDYINFKSAKIK